MIQFNLLPDVKIEYIRTKYRKRLIMLFSIAVSAVCLAIFILLFLYVRVNQTKHMSDLDKDIDTTLSRIQETPDLNKILTIQNQLNSLPQLHEEKVISSRLVDYLTVLTPTQATISDVNLDFENSTIALRGNANSLETINKFVDTIKFTDYKVNDGSETAGKAFSSVVLESFSVGEGQNNAVSYDISLVFEPVIFAQVDQPEGSNEPPISLTVPSIISTRSATEKPDEQEPELFVPQPNPVSEGQ